MKKKPHNLSTKDFLLKKTAEDLELPEDLVERVVGWSYKEANIAARERCEIEFSGLGKIYVSTSKVKRRLSKIERDLIGFDGMLLKENDPIKRERIERWQIGMREEAEYLKNKLENINKENETKL